MEGFEERWERIREKDRIFNQRMERMRKEQQESDERWELLREEQQRLKREQKNSLEGLLKSISYLGQVILESQGISNASYVASQLFDIRPENKEEETLTTTLQMFDEMPERKIENLTSQGKDEELVEQLPHTAAVETLELQMEKVSSSITDFPNLPCLSTELNHEFRTVEESYHLTDVVASLGQTKLQKIPLKNSVEDLKPDTTFRSLIPSPPWTQYTLNNPKPDPTFRSPITTSPLNPLVSASIDNELNVQNSNNPLEEKPYNPYVSNAIGHCSPLGISHNRGYDLLSAPQVPTNNNFVHEDYVQSMPGLEHLAHWSSCRRQQARPSQFDGSLYLKKNYFDQGVYAMDEIAKFKELSHSIDDVLMEKEIKLGFMEHRDYNNLLGETPKFISSICPNLQAHSISNLGRNGVENISLERTSKKLTQLVSWSGESCLAPLKPPKDDNVLLRERIDEAALSSMNSSINGNTAEIFLLRKYGRFGPVARVKMKWMWPQGKVRQWRHRKCGFAAGLVELNSMYNPGLLDKDPINIEVAIYDTIPILIEQIKLDSLPALQEVDGLELIKIISESVVETTRVAFANRRIFPWVKFLGGSERAVEGVMFNLYNLNTSGENHSAAVAVGAVPALRTVLSERLPLSQASHGKKLGKKPCWYPYIRKLYPQQGKGEATLVYPFELETLNGSPTKTEVLEREEDIRRVNGEIDKFTQTFLAVQIFLVDKEARLKHLKGPINQLRECEFTNKSSGVYSGLLGTSVKVKQTANSFPSGLCMSTTNKDNEEIETVVGALVISKWEAMQELLFLPKDVDCDDETKGSARGFRFSYSSYGSANTSDGLDKAEYATYISIHAIVSVQRDLLKYKVLTVLVQILKSTADKLKDVTLLKVDNFQVREKKAILVDVYIVSVLHVAAMGNLGKFRCVWQIQFTAFIHSWGQECSEGEGIVTTIKEYYLAIN